MKGKGFKRTLARALRFLLIFACTICMIAGIDGGGFCLAIADIPNGRAVGSRYYVEDVLDSWCELEGLLATYDTIDLNNAKIRDYDLSHFVHLGEESNTEFISKIECSMPLEIYPQMILPAYNSETKTFLACRPIKSTSNSTMIVAYQWANTMSYVYDKTRDNQITINHEIRDENGQIVLPYANTLDKIDIVDTDNNTLTITGINSPERSGDVMKVVYDAAFNGYTSLRNIRRTKYRASLSYSYKLDTEFNSAIKADIDLLVLGGVNILARNENGEAVQGARFNIYNDEECTEPAVRYNGNSWVEVDTLQSGTDGSAIATNLRPGTYYVKEVEPAGGYEINNSVVKVTVSGRNINLGLDADSGEGVSIDIYKEEVVLEPEWEMDIMQQDATFKANINNVETVNAAAYNDGGETFIRAGGSELAFESTSDVSELEKMSKLNREKYEVTAGNISESFDNPSEALDYVNNRLITGALLDDESAQDHVTISGSNLMYYDANSCETVNFSETEAWDVPPTGIAESLFALPMVLLAIIGCFCLVLI